MEDSFVTWTLWDNKDERVVKTISAAFVVCTISVLWFCGLRLSVLMINKQKFIYELVSEIDINAENAPAISI